MAGIASSPCCLRFNGGFVERFAISTPRRVTRLLRKVSCIACWPMLDCMNEAERNVATASTLAFYSCAASQNGVVPPPAA